MKPDAGIDLLRGLVCAVLLMLSGCGPDESGEARQAVAVAPEAAAEAGAPTPAPSALPDPCKLLTDEEINTELDTLNNTYKVSARAFAPFPDIGGGQCDIEARTAEGYTTSFSISVSPASTGRAFVEGGKRTPIPGIGEEAFESHDNYYAFAKGVIVQIVNVPARDVPASSARLLRAAVGRI